MNGNYIPEYEKLKNIIDASRCNYNISPDAFSSAKVKRGLREADGTGVIAGITNIGLVHGYVVDEGEKSPVDGTLYYRGYDVADLVASYQAENRFGYEECSYLLLTGRLPNQKELNDFCEVLTSLRQLPDRFSEDIILKAPSCSIMNKIAMSVLALYSYDRNPDDCSFENVLLQSAQIIARLPVIAAQAYNVKRHVFDGASLTLHHPLEGLSTSENFLRVFRTDSSFTQEEAHLLDLCLVLHAEHGGGNNSSFTCRVLSSTGTDTYSTISAAIGSLKGPKHGGANIKVTQMIEDIKENVSDWEDEDEIVAYLQKILNKQAGDKSGLIYGMGHAVYTKSDPRAVLLKKYVKKLALEHGYDDDFALIEKVEKLSPKLLQAHKASMHVNADRICANVDLYSGEVFKMLGIPLDLYTPLFAISRVSGWCAHRIEELLTGGKIIRPAYKSVSKRREYVDIKDRV